MKTPEYRLSSERDRTKWKVELTHSLHFTAKLFRLYGSCVSVNCVHSFALHGTLGYTRYHLPLIYNVQRRTSVMAYYSLKSEIEIIQCSNIALHSSSKLNHEKRSDLSSFEICWREKRSIVKKLHMRRYMPESLENIEASLIADGRVKIYCDVRVPTCFSLPHNFVLVLMCVCVWALIY